MPTKTFDAFDVVLVPFPFTESPEIKKRPAVVLSSAKIFNSHARASILAMVTTASHTPWPCDIEITDLVHAGLPAVSIIRMKLFTLDHRLIIKKLGSLTKKDQTNLNSKLKTLFQSS